MASRPERVSLCRFGLALSLLSLLGAAGSGSATGGVSGASEQADRLVAGAEQSYHKGDQLEAIKAVDQALAIAQGNVRALNFRGLIVRDQFGPKAALPWFESALLRSPADSEILANYAATLGESGQAHRVLAVTRQMIATDKGSSQAFFLQSVLAARAGNHALARAMINRLGNPEGYSAAAQELDALINLQAGNTNLAVEGLQKLAAIQPCNARIAQLLAGALSAAGQPAEVVRRFHPQALKPGAPAYLLTIVGRALEDLGRREEAAPLLDRAALPARAQLVPMAECAISNGSPSTNPLMLADATASRLRGFLAAGQLGLARDGAQNLSNSFPSMAAALALSGDGAFANGDHAAARINYQKAAQVRMDDDLLARIIISAKLEGRLDIAVQSIQMVREANPNNRMAAYLASDYAASIGSWSLATAQMNRLQNTGSQRNARLLSDLAIANLNLGNKKLAAEIAGSAWSLQRSSPLFARTLAMALASFGERSAFMSELATRGDAWPIR